MKSICEQNCFVLRRFSAKCAVTAIGYMLTFSIRAPAQPALVAPFTPITVSPVVAESSLWTTPAWGDYDNDGWLDLFMATFSSGSKNALFHNNRDGTFLKVSSGPIATENTPITFGAAWADYDNDGWLDLLVSSNNRVYGPSRLYRNTGGGSFARMLAGDVGSLATDASSAHGVSWADYDRDGYLDLFVANGAEDIPQQDFLFHNEHNGRFMRVTNAITTPQLATAHGAWADYDNDGNPDLLILQLATHNELYRTDGQGQFLDATGTSGLDESINQSVSVARGDYDNDGDLDLLGVNISRLGPITYNRLYRNRGDGTFERISEGSVAEDQDHFVSGSWVDYDNDGWLDLFVTVYGPSSFGPPGVFNRLYHNQRDGTFTLVTAGSLVTRPGNAGGAAWGDYDNDGFLDVCVAYGGVSSPQRTALYRNNGNTNSWIKIRCVGTDSNRSAFGTKVRVKARVDGRELWQMRQIGCDQDWVAFNSLDAVIGLGDATVIDTLRVEWPSGRAQEFHNVPVKQTLTLVERTELSLSVNGAGECDLTLQGPRQQRYRVDASTNLTTWSPLVSLTIINADGTASFTHTPGNSGRAMFFRAVPE